LNVAWDQHLIYFEDALAKNDRCDWTGALESWDEAIRIRDGVHARWNRGQALLSLGRYVEGFRDYAVRFEVFTDAMLNPGCVEIRDRLPLWQGECIAGKRLVLLGEQGYGDVIMASRFVPELRRHGIKVVMAIPDLLHRFLEQLAPIGFDGDLCCPFFDVPLHLGEGWPNPAPQPYLGVDPLLRAAWAGGLLPAPSSRQQRVGVAWKAGHPNPHPRDFKRSIPVTEFVALLKMPDAQLIALQPNDADEARALGIIVPDYKDFADVAAVVSLCDMIVTTDVAAINVAGAIGHRNAHVVLPYLASWRWLGGHIWYPWINRCQQTSPGDWASAFAQIR